MALILDTNAVSALLAGNEALASVLAPVARHELPVIVIAEYRYGLKRSRHADELTAMLDILIAESRVLGVDLDTTSVYADVREELRAAGTPIPENDVWIAAVARQHGLPVVSRDRHFDRVVGLRRVAW